ncbi:MAG: hypothetical protein HC892_06805 [Saprospiraceae bacterium]|nr:hypothetical protein [Saprospiraceae bacterium]
MRLTLLSILLLLFYQVTKAQLTTTANDVVKPYTAHFGYGTNVGYYPLYTAEQLGDLAMGNPSTQVPGAGITTVRPALFEYFQEQWGYELRVKTFEHYKKLGAKDNVVFVGYPSEAHRDTTYYCDSIRSEFFLNMYTPIWDNGENGTPYNDENYYAAYLYKTVTLYKSYVNFGKFGTNLIIRSPRTLFTLLELGKTGGNIIQILVNTIFMRLFFNTSDCCASAMKLSKPLTQKHT